MKLSLNLCICTLLLVFTFFSTFFYRRVTWNILVYGLNNFNSIDFTDKIKLTMVVLRIQPVLFHILVALEVLYLEA